MIQFDRLTPDEKELLRPNKDYEEVVEKIRQGLGAPASLLEGSANYSSSRVHLDLFNRWLAECRAKPN